MRCGHCGTEINPGYNTCSACGAMLQRRIGCFTQFFGMMAIAFLLVATLEYLAEKRLDWFAPAAALYAIYALGKRMTPYRWYR